MTQSRLHSFIEAWANTIVGFILSIFLQEIVAYIYNYHTTVLQNLQVVIIFTIASVIRTYYMRRLFNKLHTRKL